MSRLKKPDLCLGCPLYGSGRDFVPGTEGTGKVLLIGEAAGEEEARQGQPFVGPAGGILDAAIRLTGLPRGYFNIVNVLSCRPPNNYLVGAPYEREAIEKCAQHRESWIKRARAIVTLGDVATRTLTGTPLPISECRGYIMTAPGERKIIPTYHPAFIVRGMQALLGVVAADIRKANGDLTPDPEHFITHPTPDDLLSFRSRIGADLAVDIETPYGKPDDPEQAGDISWVIIRMSLSNGSGDAISFPWQEPFRSIALDILAGPSRKIWWNGLAFDIPRLEKDGARLGGVQYDAMLAWRFFQSGLSPKAKPARLSFVAPFYCNRGPWKHLASSYPEYYSCVDADVTWKIGQGVEAGMRKLAGCWDAFWHDTMQIIPILEQVGKQGIPCNKESQTALEADLTSKEAAAHAEAVASYPIKRFGKHLYKKAVPNSEEVEELLLSKSPCPGEPLTLKSGKPGKRHAKDCECFGRGWREGPPVLQRAWRKVEPFNPGSWQQVMDYLYYKAYKIPRNKKTGKPSTEEDELRRLATRHHDPCLKAVLEYRRVSKLRGTYIWDINEAGRVPTEYIFLSTGRIGSRKPNLQNVPKRSEGASEVRRVVEAPPGWKLVEFDYSAIEAVLVGYFASDPDYIAMAKRGVHTFLASKILGQSLAQDAAPEEFNRIKALAKSKKIGSEPVYDLAKRVIHGSSYRMGPYLLHMTYPEAFPTTAAAQQMQSLLYNTIWLKVKPWQDRVMQQAHRDHLLVNPFGYPLWIFDVFHFDRARGKQVEGQNAKAAVAFLPQSTAAGILRQALQCIGHTDWIEYLCLLVHDSFVFCVPDTLVPALRHEVGEILIEPISVLGGLTIDIAVAVGQNWADMEE